MKVAAGDGASDVSQVMAAIDWVVTHATTRASTSGVVNLSFGTDSAQSAILNPLSYAVEAAWRKGIVAVVSVGDDGATAPRVTMPAANPYIIAVGATDPNGAEVRTDDTDSQPAHAGVGRLGPAGWLEAGMRRSGAGGVVRGVRAVGQKDLLDGQAEDVGDGERQGQAGVVTLGLDGVDGLSGDVAPVGQVGLAPPACCSQFA